MDNHRSFYRRHLPHWQPTDATFFITFRLAGTFPATVNQRLTEEAALLARVLDEMSDDESQQVSFTKWKRTFAQWDRHLDISSSGPTWLKDHAIAAVVAEALHYRDHVQYQLHAHCIMPNHVHLLCTPFRDSNNDPISLTVILRSLKRHTARQANKILGRRGQFWQRESYDHVVRESDGFDRIVDYIRRNPVKAGLVRDASDWPWTYVAL